MAGGSEAHGCADRNHWGSSRVHGLDYLVAVDALQVDGGDPEVAVAELPLVTISGTPSRAISTACAWRSWCGAKRRRTPARAAVRRSSVRAAPVDQWRPHVVPLMTYSKAPT